MHKIKWLYFIVISLIFQACYEAPQFPNTPKIELKSLNIYEAASTYEDSAILVINFEDGDGDLGLNGNDILPPYHPFTVFPDENNKVIKYGDSDTLPPYSCEHYEIMKDEEDTVSVSYDTIYVQRNPNHYNYFIDIFYKETKNDEYVKYKFDNCITFNARFPYLNTENKDRPLKGDLQFTMYPIRLRLLFRNYEKIKFRIAIQDRALNRSNYIETEPFNVLEYIKKPR